MDKRCYYINLFDYYGQLLTEKQQHYFEDYYFNNLTLSEMSENEGVSRNAIHKQLHGVIEKLEMYEEKLELYQKALKIKELLKNENKRLKEQIEELL